ncbi:vitamin K epoxide reductase [Christiangramia fulva]|uniref:Vitamin K epoxide reductase n=1 Tax=Christiangramia fulva TaxID=2126553 RepID=A0A2R3Z8P2_9FLAO|nr:vitamin K epoxide reductase family protein [Christiangramia fulva]AVR46631.1 vitamin K epoxide reductase [Christiangramia fulva]
MSNKKENIPPGWDYNPATWSQRIPIVILAIFGFLIASYLAVYQLHITNDVWDPFFGNGSIKILESKVSNVLPIPDAALGAFGYLVDAVTGIIGGTQRWRKMPWIVIVFGLAVGPLGFVSVMLVVFQPVLFSAWCTLCLCSAVISIMMIGPAMDEMLASLQFMQRVRRSNASTWKAFWGVKSEIQKVK